MGWLLAKIYDPIMAQTERACLSAWRRELLASASGRVLEVGAGTGVNLGAYPQAVSELLMSEPDSHMRAQLARKVVDPTIAVCDHDLGALALPSASFDTVVATLVLCSVADPEVALAEIHRVLKPGGCLLFIEHVASPAPTRLWWQRRIEPLWKSIAGNCHITRDTEAAILRSGLLIEHIERESLRRAFPWIRPSIRGRARKAASG